MKPKGHERHPWRPPLAGTKCYLCLLSPSIQSPLNSKSAPGPSSQGLAWFLSFLPILPSLTPSYLSSQAQVQRLLMNPVTCWPGNLGSSLRHFIAGVMALPCPLCGCSTSSGGQAWPACLLRCILDSTKAGPQEQLHKYLLNQQCKNEEGFMWPPLLPLVNHRDGFCLQAAFPCLSSEHASQCW